MEIANNLDQEIANTICAASIVQKATAENFNLSNINVNTITAYYQSSEYAIDLESITDIHVDIIKDTLISDGILIDSAEMSVPKKGFRNAVFIKFKLLDKSRKCCMIFKDGGIQVKGCKSIAMGYQYARAIFDTIFEEQSYKLENIDLVLMNGDFSMGKLIDLPRLHELLVENSWNASYDKEQHCGINLKITHGTGDSAKKITIMIFQKGKFTIMGANNAQHIIAAYAFIANFLNKHHQNVPLFLGDFVQPPPSPPKKRGRKRKADTQELYDELAL